MKSIEINGHKLYYKLQRKAVKNINLRFKEDGCIYISAARSIPESYIIKLLQNNSEKYIKALEKAGKSALTDLSRTKYLGMEYPVEIIKDSSEKVIFEKNKFSVYTSDINNRKQILFLLLKWKSDKCVDIYAQLNTKVCNLFRARGYNVPLAVVTVKLMKTRWGSCNYVTGRFSMNLKLIDYPIECIYGVFCHEYMHFIHQNHSKDFHNDLEKIFPEYKYYDKMLKN